MPKVLVLTLVSMLSLIASNALATDLSGKFTVTKKFISELNDLQRTKEKALIKGYWNEPNGIKPVGNVRFDISKDIGVALFKTDAPEPKPDPVKSMNVLTGSLEKNVIIVRPKSRIKFIMKSPYDHELFSPGKHDFKPQKQGRNSFRPVDFYREGFFEVKCKLFPHFQGWVVVAPATHVIKVDKNGRYSLEGVEEGKYIFKVFFKGKWIVSKKVEVSGRKQEVSVQLKSIQEAKQDKKKAPVKDK